MQNKRRYIFVHGLSGWGSYDKVYARMPYWGMRGGDLMAYLRGLGFPCYAASVSPGGSAWDRACELYAQLTGSVTDYGAEHAEIFRHPQFGRDFREQPLVPDFTPDTPLVLIGHSFGGATVRLFAHMMQRSGKARIHSIITLAAPHNGTTAYDLFEDASFDPDSVSAPLWSRPAARMMSMGTRPQPDSRDPRDFAGFDMHIDRADELNRLLGTSPDTWYFSVPCSATMPDKQGNHIPDMKKMEPLFVRRSYQIGAYTGKSAGGILLDQSWKENDGLVNTISSRAPSHAPQQAYDPENVTRGIWQIMPVFKADHMALQGGLTRKHDIRPFYLKLLTMIEGLT